MFLCHHVPLSTWGSTLQIRWLLFISQLYVLLTVLLTYFPFGKLEEVIGVIPPFTGACNNKIKFLVLKLMDEKEFAIAKKCFYLKHSSMHYNYACCLSSPPKTNACAIRPLATTRFLLRSKIMLHCRCCPAQFNYQSKLERHLKSKKHAIMESMQAENDSPSHHV